MDLLTIILRILHITFGVFWVGGSLFLTLVLEPRLRPLGPPVQGRVMQAIMPVITPWFTISSIVVVVTGAAVALRFRSLDDFFVTDWGWAIAAGLVATLGAVVVGMGFTSPAGRRMAVVSQGMQGRPPTPDEAQEMGRLSGRLVAMSRLSAALLVVAVITMAAARYV